MTLHDVQHSPQASGPLAGPDGNSHRQRYTVAGGTLHGDTRGVDLTGLTILIGFLGGLSVVIGLWWWKRQREVNRARQWPQTEATVESGEAEAVGGSEYSAARVPVFAFSYKVKGAYYSGRFALLSYTADPGESIYARMAGRKLQVHYDPRRPEAWFLSDTLIEGCKVEQKIGPHFNNYYPT